MFRNAFESRVVILTPTGRDAHLLGQALSSLDVRTAAATNLPVTLSLLAEGGGAALIADEALTPSALVMLRHWLSEQPPWSDLPFIILTGAGRATLQSGQRAQELLELGNFSLIERPMRLETIHSAVRSALRARLRQYEVRDRQEALQRANADLEQFANSASHDLREPLRNIAIYSDLLALEHSAGLDPQGREFLESIRSSATRMNALLTDLLSYAHASSISESDVPPIPAAKALGTALGNLDFAISEACAAVTVGDMPIVRMHESHLAQLLQNLIGNALKYRSDQRVVQIIVKAIAAGDQWLFTVEDNGIGIPEAYRETIFGIFKRLHTTGRYAGTGMGLAICQRIVERYHGRIWVEPRTTYGSRFCFTVPR